MARLFIDGFETGSTQCWDEVTNTSNVYAIHSDDMTYPPEYGDFSLHTSGNSVYYASLLVTKYGNYTELWIKYRVLNTTGMGSPWGNIVKLENSTHGHNLLSIGISNIDMNLYINHYNTNLYTGTDVYSTGEWYLFNIHAVIGDSVSISVSVSGEGIDEEVNLSGVHTGSGYIEEIRLCHSYAFGASYYDDFAIDDAEECGNGWIIGLYPDSAGGYAQFTPVYSGEPSGTPYMTVDEAPPNDGDYLWTNDLDVRQSFLLTDAPDDAMTTIYAVQETARCIRMNKPSPKAVELFLRSGTTNDDSGNAQLVGVGYYNGKSELWATNPFTTSAWAKADLATLQIGVIARSSPT